jgi:hypothetical protein
MGRLGYRGFAAHGGDWGGNVTTVLAGRFPVHVLGIHTTLAEGPPGLTMDGLTATERQWAGETRDFWPLRAAYAKQQATRPQTIGHSLVDSRVGLLAWVLDKLAEWSDTEDSPFETMSRVRVLDYVTLYWLTRTGASAARICCLSTDLSETGTSRGHRCGPGLRLRGDADTPARGVTGRREPAALLLRRRDGRGAVVRAPGTASRSPPEWSSATPAPTPSARTSPPSARRAASPLSRRCGARGTHRARRPEPLPRRRRPGTARSGHHGRMSTSADAAREEPWILVTAHPNTTGAPRPTAALRA